MLYNLVWLIRWFWQDLVYLGGKKGNKKVGLVLGWIGTESGTNPTTLLLQEALHQKPLT